MFESQTIEFLQLSGKRSSESLKVQDSIICNGIHPVFLIESILELLTEISTLSILKYRREED